MSIHNTLQTLEALVSGCSPLTGELLQNDSILFEPAVIGALQIAIKELKKVKSGHIEEVIPKREMEEIIIHFQMNSLRFTVNRLTYFFLGMERLKEEKIISHPLFGKYKDVLKRGLVTDFIKDYLNEIKAFKKDNFDQLPWKNIDFFQGSFFNRLTPNGIEQLKNKIKEIGLVKREHLSPALTERRFKYFRHSKPWEAKELALLETAIKYTNDLKLLSDCFGRSENSLEFNGQKIIYNKKLNA